MSHIPGIPFFSSIPDSRYTIFRVFLIPGIPFIEYSWFQVYHLSSMPDSRYTIFRVFLIPGIPISSIPDSRYTNFRVYLIPGIPDSRYPWIQVYLFEHLCFWGYHCIINVESCRLKIRKKKNFGCVLCDKVFKRKSRLKRHLNPIPYGLQSNLFPMGGGHMAPPAEKPHNLSVSDKNW